MLAAAIDHPNIIPVYEAGEVDDVPFIAMRFVRGTDLGALIMERGPLKTDLVRRWSSRSARRSTPPTPRASSTATSSRPTSWWRTTAATRTRRTSYLTDFGLTKGRGESKLTQTGTWVGTVSYIAPEQVEGRAVDGRADLYSLACVIYEALTAHPPFERDSDIATLYAHLQDDRPQPSHMRPGMPPAVDAVVAKGMARDASERYQSGSELGRALRDALQAPVASTQVGQPIPTLPTQQAPSQPSDPTLVDPSWPAATPPISQPPTQVPVGALTQAASTPPPGYHTPPPPTYIPPDSTQGPNRGGGGRPPWLIPVGAVAAVLLVLLGLWVGGVFGGGGGEAATTTTDTPPSTTVDSNTLTTDTSVTTDTTDTSTDTSLTDTSLTDTSLTDTTLTDTTPTDTSLTDTIPTDTVPTDTLPTTPTDTTPLVVPTLSLPYQSAAGPTVRYPAGWLLRNFPRRETGGTVYFEYVNVASATFRKAPMYTRLVFGSSGDYNFYDRNQLIGKARISAKKAFKWKTAFGGAFPINISGQPGYAENFVWFVKKSYHGLGFAFAARNAATHRWIYGWAEYDTWDKSKVRAGRVDIRRKTLVQIVSKIRW